MYFLVLLYIWIENSYLTKPVWEWDGNMVIAKVLDFMLVVDIRSQVWEIPIEVDILGIVTASCLPCIYGIL